ncbi:hypothetical protein AVEN_199751-1 [Araneus ventricosus]|uniref:Transposable element P transposase n=1 Tax=Araneus ventricosus TaxID=182803 RepID=A0A4Y2J6L3_ARAVE|nr:hypothetical protein AVEN_199751-1 [Araneus ventricosus]
MKKNNTLLNSDINSEVHSFTDSLNINEESLTSVIAFIKEQSALLIQNKHSRRYCTEMLLFCSLFYSMAPHAYKFVRKSGYILLPHPVTLRNICMPINICPKQNELHFLRYIKQKLQFIGSADKTVILQIDEMHIKPYFDYKRGNISGLCFNSENAATSVVTFMISSILSSYKDVVHILPISKITADALHACIKQIVVGLDGIGFKVICVITDNNSVNQKAMSQFVSPSHSYPIVYPHPVDDKRPLFFMIDTVHLLKNIRNNWINQKNSNKYMFFLKFLETISEKSSEDCIKNVEDNSDNIIDSVDNIIDGCNSKSNNNIDFNTASFKTLKLLYETEKNSIIKYGYNLSLKALEPSNLEKQNVKLVLKIFNKFIPEGLMKQGEKFQFRNYKETAEYIKIINRWWDIVNVKTPFIGIRENNVYKKPLTSSETDERYKFSDEFLNWIEDWKNMGCKTGQENSFCSIYDYICTERNN